jgi:Na+-translocating ferredoxin:NAD+ oxidoreductase subunit C
MRRIWDIHGGVHPPENKQQSLRQPLARLPLPPLLVLPLGQHIGSPSRALVHVGQKVLKGQRIADAQGAMSACLHAPTSGTILAIEDRPIAHPSGMSAACILLQTDGDDRWCELEPCADPFQLGPQTIVDKIRLAGLAGMGGAGFPTAVKLKPADKIQTLILNGTECEPYITADDCLMREFAPEVIQGALLLARAVGDPAEILLGVEDNKPEAIAALQKAAQGTRVEVVVFPTKYPSGGEKQLIQILTGKEVPSGKLPANLGILVQNVGTAYAAWRALHFGEPLIERITTVVGEALGTQCNVIVPLGTPLEFLLTQHGFKSANCAKVIIGGPMMGYSVDDAELPPAPPAKACIRCGACAEVCPVSLLPQQLYWYAQAEDFERAQNHNLFDCIECGACSYVCPSAIPLVQYYRASKVQIRRLAAEKQKSDQARVRFEQRQERFAKAEAEKEAKRLARQKAAEEARAKLDAVKAVETLPAIEPVQTTFDDADQQNRKLARLLESAQGRVQHLQEHIQACDDHNRTEALRAQLKQAQLKLEEARKKHDDFARGISQPLETRLENLAAKVQATPLEAQQNAITTLEKRLAVAEEKVQEAEREQKPTLAALQQGVEKLRAKLAEAQAEISAAPQESVATAQDAAAAAIAKAMAKAAASANLSPQEKFAEQKTALQQRLEKAKAKVVEAEQTGADHLETLRTGVAKLEEKLREIEQKIGELS